MVKDFFNTPWEKRDKIERYVILGGGIVLTFFAWRRIKGFLGLIKETKQNVQTGTELTSLQTQNVNPTYTNTQYGIFADGLYSAMVDSWYWYGTDEDGIKSIMEKMLNDADVLKLNTTFGVRDGYSLAQWFRSEMTASYIDEYVNAPLRRNGVTFQF
jgi:hypothetical protein